VSAMFLNVELGKPLPQWQGKSWQDRVVPPSLPEPAVPRPSQRKPPAPSASRLLSRLSRPRKAVPRLAARRFRRPLRRAGGAAGAASG
jgi:hypothetical protein